MTNTRILTIEKLYKNYKVKPNDVSVIKNINLEISKGDFVMIFGPSGSGKSTLLNIILGLEKSTSGRVKFDSIEISNATDEQITIFRKDKVGIIYQQPYWIKSLNSIENVAFPLVLKGVSKADSELKARELLNRLNIADRATFHPSELSSGQQQKLSLARALITNPEIIIADEPTGNLDYKSGQELTESLAELSNEGKTILMVTHNLDNLHLAKRFIYLLDGQIVKDEAVSESNIDKLKEILISSKEEAKQISQNSNKYFDTKFLQESPKNSSQNIILDFISDIYIIIISIVLILYTSIVKILLLMPFGQYVKRRLSSSYENTLNKIGTSKKQTISYGNIFFLSYRNLFEKKIRALITIGGVSLGIGFTVFLISLGYGLQDLVISRTASLNQLKVIDVIPSIGEAVKINDESITNLKTIKDVVKVFPVVGLAGNVKYEGSNTDVVVYAVQSSYLENSDIKLISGKVYNSDETSISDNKNNRVKEIVVNLPFLNLIGLNQNNALNKELTLTYTLVNNTDFQVSTSSEPVSYHISGITSYGDSPIIYVPFTEAKLLKTEDYTSARILSESQSSVTDIRQVLNAMGFRSSSILDTISQIEGFFNNVRLIFIAIGSVALFVAALGMFNTLTVSLLERTREVGLMKAIGMRAEEVKRLFLAESITMGVFGGIAGIILGFFGGIITSLVISLISISRGYEYLNIVSLPFSAILLILLISGMTGVLTGFYPARRATKISALDALRYE